MKYEYSAQVRVWEYLLKFYLEIKKRLVYIIKGTNMKGDNCEKVSNKERR